MRGPLISFPVFVPLLLAGCGSGGPAGPLLLHDENNYATTADLMPPTVETASATDLDICWDGAVSDLQCHPLSPVNDLDNVSLLRITHLTADVVQMKLGAGTLSESDVSGYLEHHTDHLTTCMKLSQLSFNGTAIDVPSMYVENDTYTYLLLFSKGIRPGVGARTMTFLKPRATSSNTTVAAPTGCGMLTFSADLESLTKVKVSAGGPWMVDWHDVMHDGQGNALPANNIDGVTVGFYEGMTAADLEARIFDLELIATELWDIKLTGGRTADLGEATDRMTGAPFAGFDRAAAGTWMLALTCSRCQSPAPPLLTILEPK